MVEEASVEMSQEYRRRSVALLLKDALSFTEGTRSLEPIIDGLSLLVGAEDLTDEIEEDLCRRVLEAGYDITGPMMRDLIFGAYQHEGDDHG